MTEFPLSRVFPTAKIVNGFSINRGEPQVGAIFQCKAKVYFHKPESKIFIPCVNKFLPCPICSIGHKPNNYHNVAVYRTNKTYTMRRIEEECEENELATYLACFEHANISPFSSRAGKCIGAIPLHFVKDFNHYTVLMKNKIILMSS